MIGTCICSDRSLRDVSMDLHTSGCLAARRRELIALLTTPDYLDAAEALANAATPGPWRADASVPDDVVVWAGPRGSSSFIANVGARKQEVEVICGADIPNGDFIALSRALVPRLIEAIRIRDKEIAQLKEKLGAKP